MLRIFDDAVWLITELRPLVERLKRVDTSLSEQLRTALSSVGANIAEGSKAQDKKRNSHYFIAMASAEEGLAWLHMAKAWGHIEEVRFDHAERFRKIIGTLHKNVH